MNLKMVIILLTMPLIIGCGQANLTMTNTSGHDQVFCIVTYDTGQDAKHLDNKQSIKKTGLSKQSVLITAFKTEYDDDYNITWETHQTRWVDVEGGFFFTDRDFQVNVVNNGNLEVRE